MTTAAPEDPYVAQHAMLVSVHHALVGSLHAVVSAASSSAVDVAVSQALATASFLRGHHDAESELLFPQLRRLGRLRSTDAAVLDACDREHHEIHALCERLHGFASDSHPRSPDIERVAREILALFVPHLQREESALAPEQLRAMVTPDALAEIQRLGEERRRAYRPA